MQLDLLRHEWDESFNKLFNLAIVCDFTISQEKCLPLQIKSNQKIECIIMDKNDREN